MITLRTGTQALQENGIAILPYYNLAVPEHSHLRRSGIFVVILHVAFPDELWLWSGIAWVESKRAYPTFMAFVIRDKRERAGFAEFDPGEALLNFHKLLRFCSRRGKFRDHDAVAVRYSFFRVAPVHRFHPINRSRFGRHPVVIARAGGHAFNRDTIFYRQARHFEDCFAGPVPGLDVLR